MIEHFSIDSFSISKKKKVETPDNFTISYHKFKSIKVVFFYETEYIVIFLKKL